MCSANHKGPLLNPGPMLAFDSYVGIDYSGQKTAKDQLPGIQVVSARQGSDPIRLPPPSGATNWSRQEVAEWLAATLRQSGRVIAGIDHAFSLPVRYLDHYRLDTWQSFLEHFCGMWRKELAIAEQSQALASIERLRQGGRGDWRLTEQWTSSAQSVLDVQRPRSVAKASLAGIPWLFWIRRVAGEATHFWPFDGLTVLDDKSVIAEVYPSIFTRRYVDVPKKSHLSDAWAVCKWMQDRDSEGLLHPYLGLFLTSTERSVVAREGWILGVM